MVLVVVAYHPKLVLSFEFIKFAKNYYFSLKEGSSILNRGSAHIVPPFLAGQPASS